MVELPFDSPQGPDFSSMVELPFDSAQGPDFSSMVELPFDSARFGCAQHKQGPEYFYSRGRSLCYRATGPNPEFVCKHSRLQSRARVQLVRADLVWARINLCG